MTKLKKIQFLNTIILVLALFFTSCNLFKKEDEQPILTLINESGNNQTGIVSQPLPKKIRVRVEGNGAANVRVKFMTANNDPIEQTTDHDGYAETTWVLDSTHGVQTMIVKLADGSSSTSFSATAKYKPCVEENFTFTPAPVTFIPPHTNGDAEYNGHGPVVDCIVQIFQQGSKIFARVYMRAIETKSDWTTAEGTSVYDITPPIPSNREITGITNSESFNMVPFTDTDHDIDIVIGPAGGLVNKLEFIGDSSGKDAGINTRVTVYFNSVTLNLKEKGNCE